MAIDAIMLRRGMKILETRHPRFEGEILVIDVPPPLGDYLNMNKGNQACNQTLNTITFRADYYVYYGGGRELRWVMI